MFEIAHRIESYHLGNHSSIDLLPIWDIYRFGKELSNAGMKFKSIKEIRRENLVWILTNKFGGNRDLLREKLGSNQPSFVTQLISDNPDTNKPIGDKLARKN
jgi:hypothetical protein